MIQIKKEYLVWIVYINVALYATCFQLQRPIEPFLMERLTKDSSQEQGLLEYARLQSFFSSLQMVGSILIGGYLDKFGAKNGFLITNIASALSYYLLSHATTISILYMSKIPTIFQAGFLCAQTFLSQITNDGTDRIAALGRLTMAYSVGTTVGPAVGGFLGNSGDYYFGARLAFYGSLLQCMLTLLLPSEINDKKQQTDQKQQQQQQQQQSQLGDLKIILTSAGGLLACKFVSSIANSMRESTMSLILKNNFLMDEQSLGLTLSMISGVNAIINGIFLVPISKYMEGNLLLIIWYSLSSMAILCMLQGIFQLPLIVLLSYSGGLIEYLIITFALSIFQYVLSTTSTSENTSRVCQSQRGTLLGIEHSLFAAARILAPQFGISLLMHGGASAVSGASSTIFIAILIVWRAFPKIFLKFSEVKEL